VYTAKALDEGPECKGYLNTDNPDAGEALLRRLLWIFLGRDVTIGQTDGAKAL
jgi:hypothetical protein